MSSGISTRKYRVLALLAVEIAFVRTFQELVTLVPIDLGIKPDIRSGVHLHRGLKVILSAAIRIAGEEVPTWSGIERNLVNESIGLVTVTRKDYGPTYLDGDLALSISNFRNERRPERARFQHLEVREFQGLGRLQMMDFGIPLSRIVQVTSSKVKNNEAHRHPSWGVYLFRT